MEDDTERAANDSPAQSKSGLVRALGSLDALFVGFGAMIGFGWIILTGGWLDSAGTIGAVLAFAGGGIVMIFVGLVYSELVSAMPFAGGEHNYLLRGMGPKAAIFGSWSITGGYISVVMFEAVSIPKTVQYLVPNLEHVHLWTIAGSDVYLTWALVGTGTAILISFINIRGIKTASMVQTFVVSFLLVVGALLIIGMFTGGHASYTKPLFTGGAPGFIGVLVVVPFLFVGFDVIPQSAEEVKIPPRKIGRLVVISVVMAVAWYILIIFTSAVALPASDIGAHELVTADALSVLLGNEFWGTVVIAGGIAGIITSWNAFLIGASRLMWSMANAGMIPAWFGRLHPKHRTPVNAVLFIGALSAIAPFLGEKMLNWVSNAGSPAIVIAYFMVSVTFLILRRREPNMARPMRVGGVGNAGVAVGVLSVILTAILFLLYVPLTPWSTDLGWPAWVMFGLWILVGIYFLVRLPRGIKPGERAEDRLIDAVDARRSRKRDRTSS